MPTGRVGAALATPGVSEAAPDPSRKKSREPKVEEKKEI